MIKKGVSQAVIEYILIIILVLLICLVALYKLGIITSATINGDGTMFSTANPGAPTIAPTSTLPAYLQVLSDIRSRLLSFYETNNRWPRTWYPYNFTDIGLNPDDYSSPIDGLYYSPHGSNIGIANKSGDDLQVYVKKTDGTLVHLYDGWSIWCEAASNKCYYHTITPENEVDISTIVVIKK